MGQAPQIAHLIGKAQHHIGGALAVIEHQHRAKLLRCQRVPRPVPLPTLAGMEGRAQAPHAQDLAFAQQMCSGGRGESEFGHAHRVYAEMLEAMARLPARRKTRGTIARSAECYGRARRNRAR